MQAIAALIGRILLSAIFIASGFHKITAWNETAESMRAEGMLLVPFMLAGAIAFEVLGGIALLIGFRGRLAALALAVFLVPTTLIFHDFWQYTGQEQMQQMQHFMKNMAILGGLLMLAALGPGGLSVDWFRSKKKS